VGFQRLQIKIIKFAKMLNRELIKIVLGGKCTLEARISQKLGKENETNEEGLPIRQEVESGGGVNVPGEGRGEEPFGTSNQFVITKSLSCDPGTQDSRTTRKRLVSGILGSTNILGSLRPELAGGFGVGWGGWVVVP